MISIDLERSFHQRTRPLYIVYVCVGVLLATWIARTPQIRDGLGATTLEMGIVLGGMASGSFAGVMAGEALVRSVGTRAVIQSSSVCTAVGTLVLAAATVSAELAPAFLGLAVFGFGMGSLDIAVNLEGVDIERRWGRSLIPKLHGMASLGVAAGGLIALAAIFAAVGVAHHLLSVAALSVAPLAWACARLSGGFGVRNASARGWFARLRSALLIWQDRRMLLLGVIVWGFALAEGAGNDWLPLLMVDAHGYGPLQGGFMFCVFAGCMAAGRLAGSWLSERYGRRALVRVGALLSLAGVSVALVSPNAIVAVMGMLGWGLGVSVGFPLAVSAAGDGPGDRQPHVAAVARAGYLAFLVGPPVLGLVGQAFGLRGAMLLVVAALAGCLLAATPGSLSVRRG